MAEQRLIDADKNPCNGCAIKPYCHGSCTIRNKWQKDYVDTVKHGNWVPDGVEADFDGFTCSVCRRWLQGMPDLFYCPRCGANMKQEDAT